MNISDKYFNSSKFFTYDSRLFLLTKSIYPDNIKYVYKGSSFSLYITYYLKYSIYVLF